ncbi:MAG: family 43 glycosylhydrolase [Rikenellaceae bacterium]|nr:family 43 glycosylhydrolase [Rikenellaceae bacterium]
MEKNLKIYSVLILLCSLILISCKREVSANKFLNIKNDVFWETEDGEPIYSQGGGIFKFKDPETGSEKYYWYGVRYRESEIYRNDPSVTQERNNFVSVTCYSSTDLVNWKFENNVLTTDELDKHYDKRTWVGRLGVAYLEDINKYAMFVQHGSEVLVTLADTPAGSFTWHRRINMENMIGTSNTGDQTVFTDYDTGISYLVYSYGRGRNKIYISEIGVQEDGMVGLLDCTRIFTGESREGNCMFKYNGKYYMCASNIYGWDSSFAYYLSADDIRGPYLPENEMLIMPGCSEDYAHVTQTGFFINVKGNRQETVIYCGDRWANFAGNGLGYNQWSPLSFDGETPYFNSLNSWNLNHETGEWEVANDNNYVKNGSFEADRNYIPSNFKPVQDQLLGRSTEVIEGNEIAVNSPDSPVLNYFNTREDREIVIGEKSLNISDKINFRRRVSQTIESSLYVTLEDGMYTLSAKVKNSSGFDKLVMFAESDGKSFTYDFKDKNLSWTTVEISDVEVKNGSVEIDFIAEGTAEASCQIDDISLIKNS